MTTATSRPEKLRLGDVLVQQRLISQEQLKQTLELQRTTGKKVGRLLIETGIITEELLANGLARQLRIPFVNLKTFPFRAEVVKLLAEANARRFKAVVLEDKGDQLLVAMSDPLDLFAFDELTRILKRNIAIAAAPESQLTLAFDKLYRRTEEISGLARALEKDIGDAVDFGELTASVGLEGAPVVRLLQSLFEDAMQVGASDVHIEPQEAGLQIRVRVDGVLQTQTQADKRIAGALTQRLKLMGGLDISEKRLPQDGRFSVRLKEQTIDVRLSTLPATYGESVVMRLLNQGIGMRRLDAIGMPAAMLARFREVLARQSGMVLVTGPTGSGKTTTLYAALAEINADELKVITVEDPVEYRLPGITQVQVNDKIELTFAKVLRSCLRQDPDVILVGEMRDSATAEIGLRAAITGHLLLSTLHTRDAMSTPFRLMDMGVPSYMVATSLQAVIAQRLLRLNCTECAAAHTPSAQEQSWLDSLQVGTPTWLPQKGLGCSACNGSGYSGRQGVYELMEMDVELAHKATLADPGDFMRSARERMRGQSMAHHALELVKAGRTTLAEAMRVGYDVDDLDVAGTP
ncbi:GspE/PulE family protein [Rhodoferax aquaticus]|uniref:Type II/IV secretion system protein n=1 Tax=Rhodoferax aquaticus TaxID=2527691 RepID=A0A515EUX3_9BURK|nr:GspE/PulE family protein [Rhodoferax aquaticus]QDL56466.1 type II/IV secretion system protein [Rhodoferax aquaticus]